MADLTDYTVYKNNRFEVLTDKGFKDFRGIMSGNNPEKILLKFDNTKSLVCTHLHKIMTTSDSHIYAKNLKIGDKIFNNIEIVDIYLFNDDKEVYEFLDIEDTHTYFVNGILSHQCLVIDECAFVECVHGDTIISLRNKQKDEIVKLSIVDSTKLLLEGKDDKLSDDLLRYFHNSDFEILTPNGWKDFKGIAKYDNKKLLKITTDKNKSIIVSENHLFCHKEDTFFAKNAKNKMVDTIDGREQIIKIRKVKDNFVYDVVDVEDNHKFYGNGIVNHNTHLMDPFWASVFPIVTASDTSKVFMCSTPNGTGNLFHHIYQGAVDGKNGWGHDKVLWHEIPGRTEEWATKVRSGLASEEKWKQEYELEFVNTGTSSMDRQLYEELKKHIAPPIETLMDGKYKIWEHPNPEHLYVVGVDVAEGVGGDYSVIKILDITDLREIIEVAEYYDNTIPVSEFSARLYEILQHWGKPLVCIERNNQGGQVADRLGNDLGYPRMVNYGSKIAGRKSFELLGMISQRNTKYHAVANARYFYSDRRAVVFKNDHSLEELFKDFIKVNDTWQAASGKHDDRTMALVWALMILDRDVCERWFTIEELDESGKPLKIAPLDYGIKYFESPTSIYTNEQVANIEHSMLAPMAFGAFGEKDDEMASLMADGWSFLQGSAPYIDPNRNISRDQYEAMDKYFG